LKSALRLEDDGAIFAIPAYIAVAVRFGNLVRTKGGIAAVAVAALVVATFVFVDADVPATVLGAIGFLVAALELHPAKLTEQCAAIEILGLLAGNRTVVANLIGEMPRGR